MIYLPASLERRLADMFPHPEEREQFVADAVEEALSTYSLSEETASGSVGGTLHLFTDGGSRGNPGQAAVAWIVEDPARGETLVEGAKCIGIETNNVAEYQALIEGLKVAEQYRPNRLICHLDSELIVKQLNGEYRVKMATLEPLHQEVKALSLRFADIVFKHIPREDNYRADALVNEALDELAKNPVRPPVRPPSLF